MTSGITKNGTVEPTLVVTWYRLLHSQCGQHGKVNGLTLHQLGENCCKYQQSLDSPVYSNHLFNKAKYFWPIGNHYRPVSLYVSSKKMFMKPAFYWLDDLFWTCIALHDQISTFTSQKVFVCISTVLTWARTKPFSKVGMWMVNLSLNTIMSHFILTFLLILPHFFINSHFEFIAQTYTHEPQTHTTQTHTHTTQTHTHHTNTHTLHTYIHVHIQVTYTLYKMVPILAHTYLH